MKGVGPKPNGRLPSYGGAISRPRLGPPGATDVWFSDEVASGQIIRSDPAVSGALRS